MSRYDFSERGAGSSIAGKAVWYSSRRRLIGNEGSERSRELRAILDELPGYRNGPYADIRKWVQEQIEATHVRSHVVQHDSIAVRREGAAQIARRDRYLKRQAGRTTTRAAPGCP